MQPCDIYHNKKDTQMSTLIDHLSQESLKTSASSVLYQNEVRANFRKNIQHASENGMLYALENSICIFCCRLSGTYKNTEQLQHSTTVNMGYFNHESLVFVLVLLLDRISNYQIGFSFYKPPSTPTLCQTKLGYSSNRHKDGNVWVGFD